MSPTERRDIASAWIIRIADRDFSREDESELDRWLDADPENRVLFDRMTSAWQTVPKAAETPEMIAMRADALEALRTANARRWSRQGAVRRLWPIAAVVVLVFVGIPYFLLFQSPAPVIYQTGIGERRVARLSDGSLLSLDASSRVEVAFSRQARSLHLLAGRAKFDVAHDSARPFSVAASDRAVIATGTAFSVELIQRQMRVVLYQGHVRIVATADDRGKPVAVAGPGRGIRDADSVLTPGKLLVASLDRPIATVEAVDPQRSLAWEGGQLTFDDDPLAIAADRINRYSETPVRIEGRAASLPISGAFNAGDATAFVSSASAIYPLRITRREKEIILSPEP